MGVLESCSGDVARMNFSVDRSILRRRPQNSYQGNQFLFQPSTVKLFGDLFHKKIGDRCQFVLDTFHAARIPNVVSCTLKVYEDLDIFLQQKAAQLQLKSVVQDPNRPNSTLYIAETAIKVEYILKCIPFKRYDSDAFKEGLYEVAMLNQALGSQNASNSYNFQQAYVLETGIDKDTNDKVLVIYGDFANASLAEVIGHRKKQKIYWTSRQFEAMAYQLIKSLNRLHMRGICHRDIRPHNIVFCPKKQSYVLVGFQNAITVSPLKTGRQQLPPLNLSGVPYYLPPAILEEAQKDRFSQHYNYDPYLADIYALGATLLNAVFMDLVSPVSVLAQSINRYKANFPYLQLVAGIVRNSPPKLNELLNSLSETEHFIDQRQQIESLRYGSASQDDEFVSRKKSLAQGYYKLFMFDEWVQQFNDFIAFYELDKQNLPLAEAYSQIAQVYEEHGQQEEMQQYFSKASNLYQTISQNCIADRRTDESIHYLEKGIYCNRMAYKVSANIGMAELLSKLASAHFTKGEHDFARAFQEQALDIVMRVEGPQSNRYADYLATGAKIQTEFQQFKQADKMLQNALKVMERKQTTSQNLKVKAKVLQGLGCNCRFRAMESYEEKEQLREQGEHYLLDALDLVERLEGNIHPQVGSILMNLGHAYFDKKDYEKAKKSYQKTLVVKQHTLQDKQHPQIGECMTSLGNIHKLMGQLDKAVGYYDDAVTLFRRIYGSDHNQHTAVAIGNLGLVYGEMGSHSKERKEYLELAKSILRDLFGQSCPDYQYFDRQSKKL